MSGTDNSGRRAQARQVALEAVPFVLFLVAILAKVSYFNYEPSSYIDNDWYPWYREEAVLAVYGSLATLLIITAPVLLLRPAIRIPVLCIESFVLSVVVLGDVLHFRFYGDIGSVVAAGGAWQLALVWRSVIALLKASDSWLFADVLLGFALIPLYRKALRRWAAAPRRPAAALLVLAAGCLLAVIPVEIVQSDTDQVFRYAYFRFFGARKIGVLNYHIYEAGQTISHKLNARSERNSKESRDALAFVARLKPTASGRSDLFGAARGKNLIIIMVESLQSFPIGLRVGGREVMPNMTAFARGSIYFDRFFSQSADGTTSDGEFTSLQSLYPLPAGSVQTAYPTNKYRGIPRVLDERGYSTMSAHAYYGELFNMRLVHPRLGFQKSFFRENFVARDTLGLGLSDAEFFRQVVPLLRSQRSPFMAYLMTLSTHHDWKMPEKFQTLDVGELRETLLGRYLQAMNHFDSGFGEFVDSLEKTGLLNESVVAIYGDHKASYGKSEEEARDSFARLLTRNANWPQPDSGFDYRYWQVQNQIPFIVHLPHDEAAGQRSNSGGHVDIAPTLLNLLGIDNWSMLSMGRDLTTGDNDFVVFRNGSFVYGDTLCATPNASAATAKCRDTRTGGTLDPSRFNARFDEARRRLMASDVIITRDLIPEH